MKKMQKAVTSQNKQLKNERNVVNETFKAKRD